MFGETSRFRSRKLRRGGSFSVFNSYPPYSLSYSHPVPDFSPEKFGISSHKSRFSSRSTYILGVANVTKQDLIQDIARSTGCIRNDIKVVIAQFLTLVGESLAQGRTIEIRGFGTFACKERKARPARNPRTGEAVRLESRTVPTFKFSSEIKARIAQFDLENQVDTALPEAEPVKEKSAE